MPDQENNQGEQPIDINANAKPKVANLSRFSAFLSPLQSKTRKPRRFTDQVSLVTIACHSGNSPERYNRIVGLKSRCDAIRDELRKRNIKFNLCELGIKSIEEYVSKLEKELGL